jgi:rRNA maturation protein Rpf1
VAYSVCDEGFGTDYAPRTASGRAFFVVWQQLNYIVATFLFSTVTMAIIRYSRAKIAFVLERVMVRTYGPRLRRTLRRMLQLTSSAPGATTAPSG